MVLPFTVEVACRISEISGKSNRIEDARLLVTPLFDTCWYMSEMNTFIRVYIGEVSLSLFALY